MNSSNCSVVRLSRNSKVGRRSVSVDTSVSARSPPLSTVRRIGRCSVTVTLSSEDRCTLDVRGLPASTIGEAAAAHGVVLHQLATRRLSLEDAFLQLTNEMVEYHGTNDRSRG